VSDKRKKRRRKEPAAIAALREQQQPEVAPEAPTVAPAPAAAPASSGARGQFQDPAVVIDPSMSAYLFIKEWWRARERGDFDFLYALTTEDGALREHFGAREEFPEVCRRKMRPVKGIEVGELVRIRFNGPDEAHVVQVFGTDERGARKYQAERLLFLATDSGWRVHQADVADVSRDVPINQVQVDIFDAVELPSWFTTWLERKPKASAVSALASAGEIVVGAAAAESASAEEE
jgi:hypothetical protein